MTPEVGVTYLLGEDDYRYGSGPLLVRVTKVGREIGYGGEPWFEVEAMAKPPDTVGVASLRTLYLRAQAISTRRRS